MMSGNDFRKSQALRRRQKIICDDDDMISSGRAFQTWGPAIGKARLSTVVVVAAASKPTQPGHPSTGM